MASGARPSESDGKLVLERWSARRTRPVVVFCVAAVFAAFMLVAHFVVHSGEAVKALLLAAVGAVAATIPGVVEKVEYQLTESGLEKRKCNPKKPGRFERVFTWDQLRRVVPTRHGFRYLEIVHETSPLRRSWKKHVSDEVSGEVRVGENDLDRILGIVARHLEVHEGTSGPAC